MRRDFRYLRVLVGGIFENQSDEYIMEMVSHSNMCRNFVNRFFTWLQGDQPCQWRDELRKYAASQESAL